MADRYIYADEAGNFDFSTNQGASKYFTLATVVLEPSVVGPSITQLRYDLAWRGLGLDTRFHATTDAQAVRDEVFRCIDQHALRVDATIFEKRKAQPHLQSEQGLYKMAWFQHLKYVAPRIASREDRLFVVAASVGTNKRKRGLLHAAVHDVVFQVSPCASYRVAFWPAASDSCLQVADYCTWAVQRKWELNDPRSYDLMKGALGSEWEVWRSGDTYYY
jgi:hypothetical protein